MTDVRQLSFDDWLLNTSLPPRAQVTMKITDLLALTKELRDLWDKMDGQATWSARSEILGRIVTKDEVGRLIEDARAEILELEKVEVG